MDLVKFLSPKHVILVHGEKPKMALLKERIQSDLQIQCYDPANNETVCIPSTHYIQVDASDKFLKSLLSPNFKFLNKSSRADSGPTGIDTRPDSLLQVCDDRTSQGVLIMQTNQKSKVLHENELRIALGSENHEVKFGCCVPVRIRCPDEPKNNAPDRNVWLQLLYVELSSEVAEFTVARSSKHLQVESFVVVVCLKEKCCHRIHASTQNTSKSVHFCCTWSLVDEKLAWRIVSFMKNLELSAV